MKKGKCSKCKKHEYLETHHILPLGIFGQNEETIDLCSNCHTDYHNYLKSQKKSRSVKFHLTTFFTWLYITVLLIVALIFLI